MTGKQFTHYPVDLRGKNCSAQYSLEGEAFTMVARESPLYNNAHAHTTHPLLCDQFVYTFPFRSPVERILSWMKADTQWKVMGFPSLSNRTELSVTKDIASFLPNFFGSLFAAAPDEDKIRIVEGGEESGKVVQVASRSEWMRGYASNAIARWLGYEWTHADVSGRDQLLEGLTADVDSVAANDVHFLNSAALLLQMDYVLPFASYDNDVSAIEATKYAQRPFDNINVNAGFPKIVDEDEQAMWNVFARDMNRHFGIDQSLGVFRIDKKGASKGRTSAFVASITEEDWQVLYDKNYFDFRLYSLAIDIAGVDEVYHNTVFDALADGL